MAHDVFVSYSSKDKATADAVCARLESEGLRCWIAPRDILPGVDWGTAIVRAINGASAMVLVFSSSANGSRQIKREVERAVAKGVPIIPLRIEDVAPSEALEYFISSTHWLDALSAPLERHLDRLVDVVDAILGRGGATASPARAAPPTAGVAPRRRSIVPAIVVLVILLASLAGAWRLGWISAEDRRDDPPPWPSGRETDPAHWLEQAAIDTSTFFEDVGYAIVWVEAWARTGDLERTRAALRRVDSAEPLGDEETSDVWTILAQIMAEHGHHDEALAASAEITDTIDRMLVRGEVGRTRLRHDETADAARRLLLLDLETATSDGQICYGHAVLASFDALGGDTEGFESHVEEARRRLAAAFSDGRRDIDYFVRLERTRLVGALAVALADSRKIDDALRLIDEYRARVVPEPLSRLVVAAVADRAPLEEIVELLEPCGDLKGATIDDFVWPELTANSRSPLPDSVLHVVFRRLLAAGRLAHAATLAERVEQPDFQAAVFARIAEAAYDRGDSRMSAEAIERAGLCHPRIDDMARRALAYALMARAQARTGDLEAARTTVARLEGVTPAIDPEEDDRSLVATGWSLATARAWCRMGRELHGDIERTQVARVRLLMHLAVAHYLMDRGALDR